jgi:nitrile hydratase beta subunit
MDGVHDMGGMPGYGRMPSERDSQPFHASWEPIGYLSSSAAVMAGLFSADAIRFAIERIPARDYETTSYFERVITGMASLCVERGLITLKELEDCAAGAFPLARPPIGEGDKALRDGRGFNIGDVVTVRCSPTTGHCRAPRYSWGKTGRVIGVSPLAPFAGEAADCAPNTATREPTYRVRFQGSDLWPDVSDDSSVVVDLFQSYLTPADPNKTALL